MRKELSRLHLIRPQEYVNNNFEVSFGEVLYDQQNRGMVGWIDDTEKAPDSPRTARMMLVGIKFGIYVYPEYRTPELKVGSELFTQLLTRLKSKKYQNLNIYIVAPDLLDFYITNLSLAKDSNLITSFEQEPILVDNTLSHYKLRISL